MSSKFKNYRANYIKIAFFYVFFVVFLTSCAQLQNISDNTENYGSEDEKERVLNKKVENRDINLPSGSSILDNESGFSLADIFSGSSSSVGNLNGNSLSFSVSLDKVSFMPLLSVDSSSGMIVTDWYSLDNGNTRIKINIRVLDQDLTDNSISVALFSQTLNNGQWEDNGINKEQSLKIKNSILSSARDLKIASEL